MLKIGLLGYGKMGRTIEQLADQHPFEIIWRIQQKNAMERTTALLQQADVVIEFSQPGAAFDNVMACLKAGVPVISGTTGWTDRLLEAETYCRLQGGAMLWASNFSIGVNLFFALNRYLATLMANRSEYKPSLVETHHVHKLDAPSGTAITLVNELIAKNASLQGYHLTAGNNQPPIPENLVPVTSLRIGEVPGTHLISWQSDIDAITIEHRADSRAGFAKGALLAASWIAGKKGVFHMNDVLNIH